MKMVDLSCRARRWTLLLAALTAACRAGPEYLMETPILYQDGTFSPYSQLASRHRTTQLDVLYATDRAFLEGTRPSSSEVPYGTDVSETTRLGVAQVDFGSGLSWEDLERRSLGLAPRDVPVELHVASTRELGLLEHSSEVESHGHGEFAALINARIADSCDPDVLVYVHGAKVDLYRCLVRSAEFNHFAGRDMATVVFDWPSHTNIFWYLIGVDVRRAGDAAGSLVRLLELIANETRARRIHVVCYSAGARVVTRAFRELRRARPELSAGELHDRLRIGAVVFAAGDVDLEDFVTSAGDIHDLSDRVCVLSSDADGVLRMAETWMGGTERLGEVRPDEIAAIPVLRDLEHLEIVDVSAGKEERGFDIGGHHYWYRHPWISTEMILNIRGSLAADQRGLVPLPDGPAWELPADYPERARAVRGLLGASWCRPIGQAAVK
jgi:esterase/lipase superfamily enzyme